MSPFLFAVVANVVTEFAREGMFNEFLYDMALILMSEAIEVLRRKSKKWELYCERL